jgi:uncharacterized membrane protein YjjP (DUF1212 family)
VAEASSHAHSLTPTPLAHRIAPETFAEYLLDIGGTLVSYGCPAYRLEAVIAAVAAHEGYKAQSFALPTGLFLSLRSPAHPDPIVRMVRVKQWGTDLDRLVAVDAIFNDVLARRTTLERAREQLRVLEKTPPPYPRTLEWIAAAVLSGAGAVFFRGGPREIVLATAAGLLVFAIGALMRKNESGRFLVDFAGAFVAAVVAWGATRVRHDVSREVIVLAGVIALVPGMTLTTGLAELSRKNLVAGAARCMEAFVAFCSILFGIALAVGFEQIAGKAQGAPAPRVGLSLGWQAAALFASSLAFAVLFRVPRKYVWSAVASGAIGYAATALGTRHLPGHVAAFGAALAICLVSNAFARATDRPAQLFQLPGMMLLVPGSFGFLSLEDFLRGDFLDGAAKGFQMVLIAGALVTGVLLANVLLPPRKLL